MPLSYLLLGNFAPRFLQRRAHLLPAGATSTRVCEITTGMRSRMEKENGRNMVARKLTHARQAWNTTLCTLTCKPSLDRHLCDHHRDQSERWHTSTWIVPLLSKSCFSKASRAAAITSSDRLSLHEDMDMVGNPTRYLVGSTKCRGFFYSFSRLLTFSRKAHSMRTHIPSSPFLIPKFPFRERERERASERALYCPSIQPNVPSLR